MTGSASRIASAMGSSICPNPSVAFLATRGLTTCSAPRPVLPASRGPPPAPPRHHAPRCVPRPVRRAGLRPCARSSGARCAPVPVRAGCAARWLRRVPARASPPRAPAPAPSRIGYAVPPTGALPPPAPPAPLPSAPVSRHAPGVRPPVRPARRRAPGAPRPTAQRAPAHPRARRRSRHAPHRARPRPHSPRRGLPPAAPPVRRWPLRWRPARSSGWPGGDVLERLGQVRVVDGDAGAPAQLLPELLQHFGGRAHAALAHQTVELVGGGCHAIAEEGVIVPFVLIDTVRLQESLRFKGLRLGPISRLLRNRKPLLEAAFRTVTVTHDSDDHPS